MDQEEFDAFVRLQDEQLKATKQELRTKPFEPGYIVEGELDTGIFEIAFRNEAYVNCVRGVNQVLSGLAEKYSLRYQPFPEDKCF